MYSIYNASNQINTITTEGEAIVASEFQFDADYLKVVVDEHDWLDPLIIIGDVPEKKLLSIDLRPTVEKLDTAQSLDITLVFGDTSVSYKRLERYGNDVEPFYWVILNKQLANGRKSVATVIIKRTLEMDYELVGFVDSNIAPDEDSSVFMGSLQSYGNDITENLSSGTNELIKHLANICNTVELDVAVRVSDNFKGKGYGKALWLLSMASLELMGAQSVKIIGDLTKDKKPESAYSSFYSALGANPIVFLIEVLGTNQFEAVKTLVSSVYLTESQIEYLQTVVNG
jgi:hypothetical protein